MLILNLNYLKKITLNLKQKICELLYSYNHFGVNMLQEFKTEFEKCTNLILKKSILTRIVVTNYLRIL